MPSITLIEKIQEKQSILDSVFFLGKHTWKIHNLCQKYKDTDKVFLIVTHATIVNAIKKYFDKTVDYRSHVDEAVPYFIDVSKNIKGPDGYYEEPSANSQSKTE